MFGAIGDSAPDRWGRTLMQKAIGSRTLWEKDYLLGVSDEARIGALRFSLASREQVYLAHKGEAAIPHWLNCPSYWPPQHSLLQIVRAQRI